MKLGKRGKGPRMRDVDEMLLLNDQASAESPPQLRLSGPHPMADMLIPRTRSSGPSEPTSTAPATLVCPGLPRTVPAPRGPLSDHLLVHLRRSPHELSALPLDDADVLFDDDAALALHLCYELSYLGLPGVDEGWETTPSLIRERSRLENAFQARIIDLVGHVPVAMSAFAVRSALEDLASAPSPRSLSGYLATHGSREQFREFAIHRSSYQLKEADPHTWALPRLAGRAKAALVEIQRGEYGNGNLADMHANLFASVMDDLDLDPGYGTYIDRLPGVTLATGNLVTYFGLHRRWRGALVGHLALFELCSVVPMSRYADAARCFGLSERAVRFYSDHVLADAHHQIVALDDLVAGLLEDEPILGGEIVFGARALDAVERAFTAHLLDAWDRGVSSLRS